VLDRTIAVLQAVADSETDLPAADIARQLRLHKSTVHRLLVVLESYRLIKKQTSKSNEEKRKNKELKKEEKGKNKELKRDNNKNRGNKNNKISNA
jgi:DNA-binding MarR family transcriptional regulator